MRGAIVLSPIDAASQEPVVGSAQRVVVARARAPRDAAVQHCLDVGYYYRSIILLYYYTVLLSNYAVGSR